MGQGAFGVDIPTGVAIDLGSWTVTEASVAGYLAATGDELPLYADLELAPPLALCAWALGAMLDKLALPAGTVHSIQEMEARAPVPIGAEICAAAVPERLRSRGGIQFMTVAYTLSDGLGEPVQTGKTTVVLPESAGDGPESASDDNGGSIG